MPCEFCGDMLHPERAELGKTYCTKKECVRKGFKPRTVITVGLPKSIFLVAGFADEDPRAGLKDGYGARRYQ